MTKNILRLQTRQEWSVQQLDAFPQDLYRIQILKQRVKRSLQPSCPEARKPMPNTIEDSLQKLCTDYVDILYIHWWDYTASAEEVMHRLHTRAAEQSFLSRYFRHACLTCRGSERLCAVQRQGAVCHLSGEVKCR